MTNGEYCNSFATWFFFQNKINSPSKTESSSPPKSNSILSPVGLKKPQPPAHLVVQDGVRSDLLKAIRDGKLLFKVNVLLGCGKRNVDLDFVGQTFTFDYFHCLDFPSYWNSYRIIYVNFIILKALTVSHQVVRVKLNLESLKKEFSIKSHKILRN